MNQDYYNSEHTHQIEGGGDYPEKLSFFVKSIEEIKSHHSKKPLSILDVGCHSGKMSILFKKYGDVFGIDINKKAVEEANKKGIRAKAGDVFEIDTIFKNQTFDIVVAGDIIEHVFDTDLFLKKLRLTMKAGGVLLLSTPNLLSLGRRFMALTGKNPYCEYSAKEDGVNVGHIRYYTYDNLRDQLIQNGFRKVKIKTDITNIPIKIADRLLIKINPRFGRELYATAFK